ncbi:hypothetical protein D3C81_1749550 [compost metagenome]
MGQHKEQPFLIGLGRNSGRGSLHLRKDAVADKEALVVMNNLAHKLRQDDGFDEKILFEGPQPGHIQNGMQTAPHTLQLLTDAGKFGLVHILNGQFNDRQRRFHLMHPLINKG